MEILTDQKSKMYRFLKPSASLMTLKFAISQTLSGLQTLAAIGALPAIVWKKPASSVLQGLEGAWYGKLYMGTGNID